MKYTSIAALLGATVLSACGGGSSTTATPFTTISALPADGPTQLEGRGVTANYTRNTATGDFSIGRLGSVQDATLVATSENDDIVAARASAGNSAFNIDSRGDGDIVGSSHLSILSSSSDRSFAVFANPDTAGLEHMSYGTWIDVDSNAAGSVAAASFGSKTPVASMPTRSSAVYSGKGVGTADLGTGDLYATEFDVVVTTSDFSTATVTTTGTLTTNLSTASVSNASSLNVSGSGTITGSGFTANVSSTSGSGTAQGTFYGPNAEEVGGTFVTEGTTVTHIGGFGAKR